VALLDFLSAPAWTRFVPTQFLHGGHKSRIFSRQNLDDADGGAPFTNQRSHYFHSVVGVVEECLVTCAEIIQTRLSVGGKNESVLRAFSVASKSDFTFPAIAR